MLRSFCFLVTTLAIPAQAALLAYWNLNEASGDLVDSGLGSPTATGSVVSSGKVLYAQPSVPAGTYGLIRVDQEAARKFGSSLKFWGNAQSFGNIRVPAEKDQKIRNLASDSSFTVMAWIRPDHFQNGSTQRVISVDSTSIAERGWAFGIKNNNVLLFTAIGLADQPCEIGTPWKPGEWHHIAMTYQKGIVCYYFDGKLLGSVTQPFERANGAIEVNLGSRAARQDQLTGSMDEVMIFNTALSEERIRAAAVH